MGDVNVLTNQRTVRRDLRDDASLATAATGGDLDAFRVLYERHVDAIRGYLVARVGPVDAEDVLVETFAAAWSSIAKFRVDADSARPWLYGIATIQARRHRTAEYRWRSGAGVLADADANERPAGAAESFHDPRIGAALQQLSVVERDVLLLVAIGDLTVAQAARAVGITAVAARMRLMRARRRVAAHLGTDIEGGSDDE
jgi:RNA polymerase sigma-70 factor (ECF subfamily)